MNYLFEMLVIGLCAAGLVGILRTFLPKPICDKKLIVAPVISSMWSTILFLSIFLALGNSLQLCQISTKFFHLTVGTDAAPQVETLLDSVDLGSLPQQTIQVAQPAKCTATSPSPVPATRYIAPPRNCATAFPFLFCLWLGSIAISAGILSNTKIFS